MLVNINKFHKILQVIVQFSHCAIYNLQNSKLSYQYFLIKKFSISSSNFFHQLNRVLSAFSQKKKKKRKKKNQQINSPSKASKIHGVTNFREQSPTRASSKIPH